MPSVIERIVTRVALLPLPEPVRGMSIGTRTQKSTLIVEVHASSGAVGFGYASVQQLGFVKAVDCIVGELAPLLQGMDVARREAIYQRMWTITGDLLHEGAANLALGAIDVALWDLAGKEAGQPLWKLLGGTREAVPAYASWSFWRYMEPARLESEAAAVAGLGYTALKMRMGQRPLAEDLERARLIRAAVGPDMHIMVDALWSLTGKEAQALADGLAAIGCSWLEEPVREGDYEGLAQVRATSRVPLAAGERISRLDMLPRLADTVDHVILDVYHLGGITPWLKAAALLDQRNKPLSGHANPYVSAQLLAAARTGAWVEFMPWMDMIFVDPPVPRAGMITLPDAPGLGLVLDEEALARYAVK